MNFQDFSLDTTASIICSVFLHITVFIIGSVIGICCVFKICNACFSSYFKDLFKKFPIQMQETISRSVKECDIRNYK